MNDTFSLLQKYTGISKYSKSEVITPQWVVSDMVDLLPQEVFNPDATFLDPAVKSGRFLIEIYHRLMNSDSMKQAFPDEQDRHQHIIENQLYGFATSPTAATVVRKTLYDDPLCNGNVRFTSDKLTKEQIQGAFNNMKFDVVISNPPYNKGADLDFVDMGFELSTQYCVMITPAKWQTAEANQGVASKNITYGKFREKLVPHMSHVCFFPCCKDVFDIYQTDGITYYILDKEEHSTCVVENRCTDIALFNGCKTRPITKAESLLNIGNEIIEYMGIYPKFEFMTLTGDKRFEVWMNTKVSGYDWYATKSPRYVLSTSRLIDNSKGQRYDGEAKCIFESDSRDECESFRTWIYSKFTRFFLVPNISKLNNIQTNHCFRFVPAPPSGKFDHIYTDEELYKAFNLPQKYIDAIEAVIKERK